jgi:hypothetical protein
VVWPFTSNARRKNGKKVYKWKPMLRRPLGRPKNRWEGDVRNDIKKTENKELDKLHPGSKKLEIIC